MATDSLDNQLLCQTAPVARSREAGAVRDDPNVRSFHFGSTHWRAAADLAGELFDSDGLRLASLLKSKQAETIKSGPHRIVYRLQIGNRRFYLKQYRASDWQARLKNILRPCLSQLEWQAARRVAQLGIPTIHPVAIGQTMSGRFVRDNYLITGEIERTQSLHDFAMTSLPELTPAKQTTVRQQIAQELGMIVGRLHRGGLIHRDLHAGNLLVRIDPGDVVRLWLIDLHAVSPSRKISRRHIERNLSQLYNFFARLSTGSDRLRFFHAYFSALHHPSGDADTLHPEAVPPSRDSFSQMARRVESFCRRAVVKAYRGGDRKWVRGNRRLIIADAAGVLCRGIASLGSSRLAALRDDPEKLFADENVLFWCRRTPTERVAVVRLCGERFDATCHVKLIEGSREPASLLPFRSQSRFRKSWEGGHALERRWLETVQPILFVETKSGGHHRCCLVTKRIPNAIPLSEFLRDRLNNVTHADQESWLASFVNRLAGEVAWMHTARVDHQALTAENILVAGDIHEDQFWWNGHAHVRCRRWLSRRRIVCGLGCLNASVREARPLRTTHRLRFLRRYLGSRFRSDWKDLWRQIDSATKKTVRNCPVEPLRDEERVTFRRAA